MYIFPDYISICYSEIVWDFEYEYTTVQKWNQHLWGTFLPKFSILNVNDTHVFAQQETEVTGVTTF